MRQPVTHGGQDDSLDESPSNQQMVVAGSLFRTEAAVVATTLAADLGDRRTTGSTGHRP